MLRHRPLVLALPLQLLSEFNFRSLRLWILVDSVALGLPFLTVFQFAMGCRGWIAQLVYWFGLGRKVRCSNLLVTGCLHHFVQSGCATHANAGALGTAELPQLQSGSDNATTHTRLASRLRMGRALCPLCACMACYVGDLYLTLFLLCQCRFTNTPYLLSSSITDPI